MPCIFEFVHRNAIKRVCSIIDDLVALLQGGRCFVDFTTSDEEQFVAWCLNVHKVVLERGGNLHSTLVNDLGLHLVLVDELCVSLQDVDVPSSRCSSTSECHCSNSLATFLHLNSLSPSVVGIAAFQFLHGVVGGGVDDARTSHLVNSVLWEEPVAFAFVAIKSERVI